MDLLAANLAQIDAEAAPAYLESSNPTNNARYERLGFKPHGEFSTPEGRHTVTTMWREPSRPTHAYTSSTNRRRGATQSER
jgi:hypothetical protein